MSSETEVRNGYDLEDLSIGMTATYSRTVSEADIVLFAGASGDTNPIHFDEEFAAAFQTHGPRGEIQIVMDH